MGTNKQNLSFDILLEFFEKTHSHLQKQAAKSIDIALVVRNWLFGWYIVEFENGGAEREVLYGKKLIVELSLKLKQRGLNGISPTNLHKFREFYKAYPKIQQTLSVESIKSLKNDIQQALSAISSLSIPERLTEKLAGSFKLGWSHYVTLLTIKTKDERNFYEIEAIENDWSLRELKRQIKSSLYERLALSRDKKKVKELSEKGQQIECAKDIIKNPYILEFLDLHEHPHYSEHELETAIIDKIENFLLELGKGFLFEARQKRFSFDDDHFYVDLVFYNRLLKCYVLVDLKRDKLSHQDIGQMQMYVNYFDRFVKLEQENPTVGILLCHQKNNAVVELTLPKDTNIHASEYKLYLPSKDEFRKQLKEAQRYWNENK